MLFGKKNYEEQENEIDNQEEIRITEEEVLANPQKEMAEGVETEEYDIKPVFKTAEEQNINLEEEKGIEIEYTFNGDEVTEALRIFQRDTIFKRNIIYSGILIILFIIYTIGVIKDPTQYLSLFLAVMCISVLGFIWYLPLKHVKKTAKAANDNNLEFTMIVYDKFIKIGEENGSYILNFKKEITKIVETQRIFLICAGKDRVFILPKRCLEIDVSEKFKQTFKAAMAEKYIVKEQ